MVNQGLISLKHDNRHAHKDSSYPLKQLSPAQAVCQFRGWQDVDHSTAEMHSTKSAGSAEEETAETVECLRKTDLFPEKRYHQCTSLVQPAQYSDNLLLQSP